MKFASETTVSVEKSRAEIEGIVRRYGATSFASGWTAGSATIAFEMRDRHIRFLLPLPLISEERFRRTHRRRQARSQAQVLAAWEQACRQRWRALALAVKAKLEAVESGISEFEAEFMAHIVMPDGRTIGEHVLPKLESVFAGGPMPPLLGYTPRAE